MLNEVANEATAPVRLPQKTLRRAKLAQLRSVIGSVMGAALIVGGGFAVANLSTWDDAPQQPAGARTLLGSGETGGSFWTLSLEKSQGSECFRLTVAGSGSGGHCFPFSTEERFDVVPGVEGDLAFVFGVTKKNSDVGVFLEDGRPFAALIYPGDDSAQYFFRPFTPNEIAGVVNVTDPDGTLGGAEFSTEVSDDGEASSSSVKYRWHSHYALPGFEGLPGEIFGLVPGTLAGESYNLVLRATADELCFHLEEQSTCRAVGDTDEPLRLHISHHFGDFLLIAGEVDDTVDSVVVKEGDDDSYTAQLREHAEAPGFGRFFVVTPTLTGQPVVAVLYDASGDELDRVQIQP